MNFKNDVTKLLKIDYPIISAPMANVSGALLACEVTKAGGLGMIGGGYCNEQWVTNELEKAEANMFGIGFITWRLQQFPQVLALAIKHQPRAIMLSFGDIKPFVAQIKAAKIPLICQVQTVEQAVEVKKQGADIIVAQGAEAGGHGASRGTLTLVPAVVDVVGTTPVIAAGGICDARGLAACLMLGAQGVLMGTRFYASEEALGSDLLKQKLVNASGDETIRTNLFDFARGFTWPKPYTARALTNEFTKQWQHEKNLSEKINQDIQDKYQKAMANNDFSMAGVFAGEGVDMIHDIMPAQHIIKDMITQFEKLVQSNLQNGLSKYD